MTTNRYYEGWRLFLTAELAGISQLLEQMTAQISVASPQADMYLPSSFGPTGTPVSQLFKRVK